MVNNKRSNNKNIFYRTCSRCFHEVKQMLKSLDLENEEKVNFEEFVNMISEVSKKDYEAWVSFTFFDINGDGTISKDELKKGMKRIGHLHDKKTIKTMMKDADTELTRKNIQQQKFLFPFEIYLF